MNLKKIIAYVCIAAIVTLTIYTPVLASRLGANKVIPAIYAGIRQVDVSKANPKLKWNVPTGADSKSNCGKIGGSMYCTSNNTIYIAKDQIQDAYKYGDAAIAYIVAHEYSHAIQEKSGIDGSNNVTRHELQADCLAGFYMGIIPNVDFDEQDIREIAAQAYAIGDKEFNNAQHHGTPRERQAAVLKGFEAASTKSIQACR
jgi:uncharacterized protein